jgi:hypothetical protein
MSNGKTYTGKGRSDESFRHAARKAVSEAEKKHKRSGAKGNPPTEYELTFYATAKPGSSLSEYIVVAKGTI